LHRIVHVTGAEFIINALRTQGVDTCFMVPGNLVNPFSGPLTETPGFTAVVAGHEGGAAFMAAGYAAATTGLGVAIGIGGPGVLNMATAIAAVRAERLPLLVIGGEVPTHLSGLGGFQDASIDSSTNDLGALSTLTALSLSVGAPNLLPHHLRRCISTALSERAPVYLSVPTDVLTATIDEPWIPIPDALLRPYHLDDDAFHHAMAAFDPADPARNVVILAGDGVRCAGGATALREFAERFHIPVATTLPGKGVLPEDHPLSLGVFGYGGSRWATEAILSPDVEVLIVVGAGLTQRDTLHWDSRMRPSRALIHIADKAADIGRTWADSVPIVADEGAALAHLADLTGPAADGLDAGRAAREDFLARIQANGSCRYAAADVDLDQVPMHPARVVAELRRAAPPDTVLTVDSGAHRAWFSQYWDVSGPGAQVALAELGPMGCALPLGIGVGAARPGVPILVGIGDGCMLMHGQEIHTAAQAGIPIIVAVMNNASYGHMWFTARDLGEGPIGLTDITGNNWALFGKALGGEGEVVERAEDIAGAMQRALTAGGPYVLDLRISRDVDVPLTAWRDSVRHWMDDH